MCQVKSESKFSKYILVMSRLRKTDSFRLQHIAHKQH